MIVIIFSFCEENKTPLEENDEVIPYNIGDFEIRELPYYDRPYNYYSSPVDLNAYNVTDSNGVIMFVYKGNKYYHPVGLSGAALHNIFSYITTQNSEYLARAEKYMQKLIDLSYSIDDNIYLTYDFDIDVHGNGYDSLVAPWYSGMAQGMGLAALVRLYIITGNSKYIESAKKVYSTFKGFRSQYETWTVFIDEDGYYWIEEYPINYPEAAAGRVLNGFIYSIYGLYDYYLLTKDPEVKNILLGSITTIYNYIPQYRDIGDLSFYCLRHLHKDALYHRYHQLQLSMLTNITGDPFFQAMADSLYNDYH